MSGADAGFLAYLLDQLDGFDGVAAKRMFGGNGLFRDGTMFAIVTGGALYLKTDDGNRATFEARGAAPFTYLRAGKEVRLSYHEVPEDVVDNADLLVDWATAAWEAARRAAA
jgi:DNA transformation protein and related proteins